MKRCISAALALALFLSVPALAAGYRLAPYKDDLFKYPKLLSSEAAGDYVVIQYIQQRDLDERDVVPEKKTKDEYLSLDTKAVEQDLEVRDGATTVKVIGDGCGQIQEGSGFVVGAGIVVTNAHVVAGIPHPVVEVGNNLFQTTVLSFDP